MLIRFGLHVDAAQPRRQPAAIGDVTLGPLGLLDVLEVQLGLAPVVAAAADRLTEYRACLAQADAAERFYHASFGVDPINAIEQARAKGESPRAVPAASSAPLVVGGYDLYSRNAMAAAASQGMRQAMR